MLVRMLRDETVEGFGLLVVGQEIKLPLALATQLIEAGIAEAVVLPPPAPPKPDVPGEVRPPKPNVPVEPRPPKANLPREPRRTKS